MPELTVLMAVYNGMPYLPQAIESILNQTWKDFEFLIINDASTDNSRDVIAGYNDPRIRLLDNEENINQTKSLNRGMQHANTELIARMDVDDISYPRRLERQIAYLQNHSEVAVVGISARCINSSGKITGKCILPQNDTALRWMQLFGCFMAGGAAMFRRSVIWDELGGFDPSISFAQDWELWSRVPLKYKLANLPEPLIDFRLHPSSSSVVYRRRANAESEKIKRLNLRRMFDSTPDSEKWLNQIDDLIDKCNNHPKYQLELIDMLFKRFCTLYPNAGKDPETLRQMSGQYLHELHRTDFHSLPTALKILGLAWPISPKRLYLFRLLRWMAACIGIRGMKHWFCRGVKYAS